MKVKKLLCLSLAAAMIASLGTACGKKSGSADMDELMSRENVEDYVYEEQIELKIPVYDRGTPGLPSVTDNYWTKYVQENFGDKHNIKMTYIAIPRTEEITKFNQLLAGKEENQPDIIFNYDYPSIVSFADQDAFIELNDDFIKKYAPTYYEKTKELDEYTYLDGKKMFLGAVRPLDFKWVNLIRKDWVEKAGYSEVPTTEEEYYQMLLKFRDMQLGGEGTIATTKTLANANYGNYMFREQPLPERDNALYSDIAVCSLTWEPTKKQLEYDNKMYNDGLVSPEWYLDVDGSKAKEAFISGKAGVYGCYLTKSPDIIGMLKANVPDAEVESIPGRTINGEKKGSRKDNPFGMMSGINVNCKHPEAVLMYFEWLSQEDNLFTMQNGIEGKTYNMVDGIPVIVDDYAGEDRLNYSSNKDMWCLVTEGKDLGSEELNVKAQARTYAPEGYEFLIEDAYKTYKENEDLSYCDYIFNKPVSSLTEYGESLKAKWQEYQVDLINCKPEEFEAKYEAACKDYLAAGYQAVLDEKAELYEEQSAGK